MTAEMFGLFVGYAIGMYALSFLTTMFLRKMNAVSADNSEPALDQIKSLLVTYVVCGFAFGFTNAFNKSHAESFIVLGGGTALCIGAVLLANLVKEKSD